MQFLILGECIIITKDYLMLDNGGSSGRSMFYGGGRESWWMSVGLRWPDLVRRRRRPDLVLVVDVAIPVHDGDASKRRPAVVRYRLRIDPIENNNHSAALSSNLSLKFKSVSFHFLLSWIQVTALGVCNPPTALMKSHLQSLPS